MLLTFIQNNWPSILLTLVTTGSLAFCKHLWSRMKNYKQLLDEKNSEALDDQIEEKLNPIAEEVEKLREYIRQVDQAETYKMNLIIDSYKFRLVQLCKLYLKQGESKTICFSLPYSQLGFYNDRIEYVVENGEFEVFVGTDSECSLKSEFTL